MATGGGAYKFYDKIRDALGVDVLREDEMECLIIGKRGCWCWGASSSLPAMTISFSQPIFFASIAPLFVSYAYANA